VFRGNSMLRGAIMEDCCVHDIDSNTPTEGGFNRLFASLKKDGGKLYGYFRMNPEIFDYFLTYLFHGPQPILKS
jgi:hypothetical protein